MTIDVGVRIARSVNVACGEGRQDRYGSSWEEGDITAGLDWNT